MENSYLTAIIIDDEKRAIASLKKLLAQSDRVKVLGSFTRPAEAIDEIFTLKPDILFLDIQMPVKSGFEVAEEIRSMKHPPTIVFITGYEKYAIDAIRHAAFDFLLKPVDPRELDSTIKRIEEALQVPKYDLEQKLEKLQAHLAGSKKIKFNTCTGFIVIDTNEIAYLEASRNYCDIYLADGTNETVTMNMNSVHAMLPSTNFFRISRFHIININFLRKLERRTHTCQLKIEGELVELAISHENAKMLEHEYFKTL